MASKDSLLMLIPQIRIICSSNPMWRNRTIMPTRKMVKTASQSRRAVTSQERPIDISARHSSPVQYAPRIKAPRDSPDHCLTPLNCTFKLQRPRLGGVSNPSKQFKLHQRAQLFSQKSISNAIVESILEGFCIESSEQPHMPVELTINKPYSCRKGDVPAIRRESPSPKRKSQPLDMQSPVRITRTKYKSFKSLNNSQYGRPSTMNSLSCLNPKYCVAGWDNTADQPHSNGQIDFISRKSKTLESFQA